MSMSATSGIEMTSTDLLSSVSQEEIEINSPTTTFVASGKTVAPNGYGMLLSAPTQTYTATGSTEWVSQANFIASGAFSNAGTTNDFLISSVGDVEIGPNGAAGAYQITTPVLRASAGRGMQITNANNNMLVAGTSMVFNTGTTEDYSTVRVGISGSNNQIVTSSAARGGGAGNTQFLSDNNILLTGNSRMNWATTNTPSNIRFTATKGDILFRSTSINPANHDLRVVASAATSQVFITAFHRIDNRQHQSLGFFYPDGQTSRTSFAAAQQGTTNILTPVNLLQT